MKIRFDGTSVLCALCVLLFSPLSLSVLSVCSVVCFSHAQSVPDLINYQGRLLTSGGDPAPTAEYAVTGSLFTAASGGDAVWTETLASVPVVRGYFNVMIGGSGGPGTLQAQMNQGVNYIEVKSGPYTTGRQQFVSVPYALRAAEADHALAADSAGNASNLAGRNWSSILLSGNDPSSGFIKRSRLETAARVPPGTIVAYYLSAAPPDGWLLCDGLTSVPVNSELYALGVHTTPDFRAMFLRGRNGTRSDAWKDPGGDRAVGAYQPDELKSHEHQSPVKTWMVWNGAASHDCLVEGGPNDIVRYVSATGGDETRPKNVAVNYIIKY